jgi:hypothetical protein
VQGTSRCGESLDDLAGDVQRQGPIEGGEQRLMQVIGRESSRDHPLYSRLARRRGQSSESGMRQMEWFVPHNLLMRLRRQALGLGLLLTWAGTWSAPARAATPNPGDDDDDDVRVQVSGSIDQTVKLQDLPPAVQQAILEERGPRGRVQSLSRMTSSERGTWYVAQIVHANGASTTLEVASDGTVVRRDSHAAP